MHLSHRPSLCIVHSAFCIALALSASAQKFVEYIASNGSASTPGECILLDYTPTADSVVEASFAILDPAKTHTVFCSRSSGTSRTFTCFYIGGTGFRWDYNSSQNNTLQKVDSGATHTIRCSNAGFHFDGTLVMSISSTSFTPGNRMMLFASYNNQTAPATPTASDNYAKMRLYSFKAWDDNGATLRVDLYPYVDANGVAALYDAVTDTIYYNQKSGTSFTASQTEVTGPAAPGRLDIAGSPQAYGEPTPAYGAYVGMGESRTISCPVVYADANENVTVVCTGWKLYDAEDNVISNGVGNAFTYIHPSPAAYRRLEWQWSETSPALLPGDTAVSYTTASFAAQLATAGEGASSATVSFAYGTDAENLPAPSVIANGLAAGQTATANLTGLADNTTYHYAFTSVNDASPAQSYTMTGSFTTRAFGSPEIAVRATPGLQTSTIAVTVKTPGSGVPTCDVYVATGADPDSLDPEERIGDDVGIGAVVTKSVASPTTPYLTYYAVRVVNAEGKATTVSGTLDTEIKWYFDAKNSCLTNATGWKVAASQTTVDGVTGYSIDGADAIKAAPKDGSGNYLTELDLTGLKNTGLDIISLGGHLFRDNGGLRIKLTKLHLPGTIMKISDYAFVSTTTILDFEPHEFPDLVTHATPGVPTALFANPVVSFPNPGYKTYPQQMWQAVGAKKIYLGYGLTAFGNYAIDAKGPTDIYLTGDAVPATGTGWTRQITGGSAPIRINVPVYSEAWKAYAAVSAAAPTTAQEAAYAAAFTDGRPLWKVGKASQTPNYGGIYLSLWAPDDYCRNALHVRGNVSAGEPSPAYGKHKYVPQSVAVSAPAAATYENVAYVCAGYILEALGDDGWGAPVTNLNANSFTLHRDGETSYRLTWLWNVAGFALQLDTAPPSGLTYGDLVVSPANTGNYAPGTVVTITAPATGSGDWTDAVFDHWEGDVPSGNEKANPLVVTMDRARRLTPVYAANWRAVEGYATTRITDGYFTLACKTADNEITLGYSCGLVAGGVDVLDLRKPVADGRAITALKDYTFSPNAGSTTYPFKALVLPDTLKSISGATDQGGGMLGKTGVERLVNTFPDSLEVFSGGMHGLTGNWEGDPVYLLNKNLTAIPSQIFGTYSGGHAYHLGVNIASIPNYAFDAYSGHGVLSVYLYGETKPAFRGGDWHRGASATRVVVPRSSAVWKEWLAANTTVPTAAQTNTYNTVFADREPREKLVGIGKNVDYQNGVFFCTWPSPAAESRRTILFLR